MFDSPYRLTIAALAGGLVSAAGVLCASLLVARTSFVLWLPCFAVMLAGMISMVWITYRLRAGVQNERWSEEALAPFRRMIDHPAWKCAMIMLIAAMFIAIATDRSHRPYYWCCFLLLQTQTQIGGAFARQAKLQGIKVRIDAFQASALSSQHWGER